MKELLPFLLLFPLLGFSQNLVPNPSFEEYFSCPTAFGQVDSCMNWSVYRETPDYYNSCSDNALLQVPSNFVGFQQPFSGNAYLGLWTYSTTEPYRESVGAKLVTPTSIGVNYYVSIRVARAENEQGYGTIATNGLGVKFSTVPYSVGNPVPIDNNPAIWSNHVITDSLNWTVIEGFFVADSAYEYLAIGNFFDDSNTDTLQLRPPAAFAVYYVDDVCVSADPNKCHLSIGLSEPSSTRSPFLYPNPTSGFLRLRNAPEFESIRVFDSMGSLVFEEHSGDDVLNLDFLPSGIYSVSLKNSETTYHERVIINH